jgi:hypothetical protein
MLESTAMPTAQAWIVGCNHGIQRHKPDVFESQDGIEQQGRFRELLTNIVKSEIQLICEEWGRPEQSIAQTIANGGKVRWANINTTLEELDQMKIPCGYVNGEYPQAQKEHWHREREKVFMKKILETKGDAGRFLVICGFTHFDPMAENLKSISKLVEAVDYRKMDWYNGLVFPE